MKRKPLNGDVPNSIRELDANAYDWMEGKYGELLDVLTLLRKDNNQKHTIHLKNGIMDRVVRFFSKEEA
jgi:hypothetical protein